MIYFLLGVLFAIFAMPIVQSVTTAVCTRIEEYIAKHSVQIGQYNKELMEGQEPPSQSFPIGFQYEPIEEIDDFYEE